jgi:hypothetical protein
MSDSSVVSRFIRSGGESLSRETDEDLPDNLGCFGWLRGVRERSVMLELRRKNGCILAIGYAWVERLAFDPSTGITLHAAGLQVRIIGRNLNGTAVPGPRLFEGLARHRVPWICELSELDRFTVNAQSCIVDAIEW